MKDDDIPRVNYWTGFFNGMLFAVALGYILLKIFTDL